MVLPLMNILDFEKTSTYRSLLIHQSKLSEDNAFCVLTCLLDLENRQYVTVTDWNALVQEHCQYNDIMGGLYFAIRKFITEQQSIVKSEHSRPETLIKLSEVGKAMLDQIRLEVCIDEENTNNVALSF